MIEKLFKNARRALVVGIGGGGDIIGCVPTAKLLNFLGAETILGGLSWERKVVDPKIGPRRIDELVNLKPLSETVALANAATRTTYGTTFAESIVAEYYNRDTVIVDINGGVEKTLRGLNEAVEKLGVDLVVGIDVGGDSLARGDEKGIRSPLADSIMLCVLARLRVRSVHGVIGWGCDGELTLEELNRNVAEITARGGLLGAKGMGSEEAEEIQELVSRTYTEASKMVAEAARGGYGERTIRAGSRKLWLTPFATVTFYFEPRVVFNFSQLAKMVGKAHSLREADALLRSASYKTELYFEEQSSAK